MKTFFAAAAAIALASCGGGANTSTANTSTNAGYNTTTSGNMMAGNTMSGNMAGGNMSAGGGAVRVTVSGVRANGGPVLVALQSEGEFARSAGSYTETVQPSGTSVTATFNGVTPGRYAAAVVQDTNSDGTFTIGSRGPSEPFGFSGGAQSGTPTFGPAAFEVTQSGGAANVTLAGGN